jgi:hypothetical protein
MTRNIVCCINDRARGPRTHTVGLRLRSRTLADTSGSVVRVGAYVCVGVWGGEVQEGSWVDCVVDTARRSVFSTRGTLQQQPVPNTVQCYTRHSSAMCTVWRALSTQHSALSTQHSANPVYSHALSIECTSLATHLIRCTRT